MDQLQWNRLIMKAGYGDPEAIKQIQRIVDQRQLEASAAAAAEAEAAPVAVAEAEPAEPPAPDGSWVPPLDEDDEQPPPDEDDHEQHLAMVRAALVAVGPPAEVAAHLRWAMAQNAVRLTQHEHELKLARTALRVLEEGVALTPLEQPSLPSSPTKRPPWLE